MSTAEAQAEMNLSEKTFLSHKALMKVLRRITALSSLSEAQLARIARAGVTHFGPDEFIVKEGSGDLEKMIVILAGSVFIRKRVFKGGAKTYEQMAEITGPTIVGENSFFTGLARSAGVYAKERVPGITISKQDFMRLASLDKNCLSGFLRHIADENMSRAERTAVLYMNTLQLILTQATISDFGLSKKARELRKRLEEKDIGPLEMKDLVGDVLMLLRKLNENLEELYSFANLPEMKILSINRRAFKLNKDHKFHDIYTNLANELVLTQELVPLETLNFKDFVVQAVVGANKSQGVKLDYPAIISLATEAYSKFSKVYDDVGCEVRLMIVEEDREEEPWPGSSLLWD